MKAQLKTLNFLAILSFIFLSACASYPPFSKGKDGGQGYSVTDQPTRDHFLVNINLPEGTDADVERKYLFRSVGQECKDRKFDFFDVGVLDNLLAEGFCYKDSTIKSLAITFAAENLAKENPMFIVEDLNAKSRTYLEVGDQVLKIEGVGITSVAQLKRKVFELVKENKASAKLEISRAGKTSTVEEPIAEMANGGLSLGNFEF